MSSAPILAGGSATAGLAGDAGRKLVGNNFDAFLKMLTTQMTNQNPMSPMSTHEFTAQLVQFSQVEQLMNMSRSIERGVVEQRSSNMLQAMSLVGNRVSVVSDLAEVRRGEIAFDVEVPTGVSELRAFVTDSAGAVVQRQDLPSGAGTRSVSMPAFGMTGAPLQGSYRIQVIGRNAAGAEVPLPTTSWVDVTGIERAGDGVKLRTSAGSAMLQDVVAVK